MKYIDTHLHLTDSRLWPKKNDILFKMKEEGIVSFLNAGFNKDDWLRQKELKENSVDFKSAWGLHPYWIHANKDTKDILEKEFQYLQDKSDSYDCIGETGLDLRNQFESSIELQKYYFHKHLDLAKEQNKVLILHLVRNLGSALKILKSNSYKFSGIAHSFSGSLEEAKELVKLGFLISISTSVCNDQAKKLKLVAKEIPLEKLVIETDSPDQPPPNTSVEYNYPWNVKLVAKEVAALKSIDEKDVVTASNSNFESLFS